jgi:hypothetical protein
MAISVLDGCRSFSHLERSAVRLAFCEVEFGIERAASVDVVGREAKLSRLPGGARDCFGFSGARCFHLRYWLGGVVDKHHARCLARWLLADVSQLGGIEISVYMGISRARGGDHGAGGGGYCGAPELCGCAKTDIRRSDCIANWRVPERVAPAYSIAVRLDVLLKLRNEQVCASANACFRRTQWADTRFHVFRPRVLIHDKSPQQAVG